MMGFKIIGQGYFSNEIDYRDFWRARIREGMGDISYEISILRRFLIQNLDIESLY